MLPETPNAARKSVLSRIAPEDFTGRDEALNRITALASNAENTRGIIVLAAPSSGATELLRQGYDKLFHQPETDVAPVYFNSSEADGNAETAARRFLHTFLLQTTAYVRRDPALLYTQPTLADLTEMLPITDELWIKRLIEKYERVRVGTDEEAMVRLCLSAPGEAAAAGRNTVLLFDDAHLVKDLGGRISLSAELGQMLARSGSAFVLSGLRRRLLDVLSYPETQATDVSILHLENLDDEAARALIEKLSRRLGVKLNDATRDLIAQQFSGNPLFITAVIHAARQSDQPLTSFLSGQKAYVVDLMGGRINRRFDSYLARVAPSSVMRRTLLRLLRESAMGADGQSPLESWQKRLNLTLDELQTLLGGLRGLELASRAANFVKVSDEPVWRDYLRAQYKTEVAGEPRARVVAEILLDALKRAPQTLERHYRRKSALALRPLLERFNWQRVPASLLQYENFNQAYAGREAREVANDLATEVDLVRLPQIVHTATVASYYPTADFISDEDQYIVAHGFDGDSYTEAGEVVWIAVMIGGEKAAGRGGVELWHERLMNLARRSGFKRIRVWLIAASGFTPEAIEFLREKDVYASNKLQIESLALHLDAEAHNSISIESSADEFEIVIPMGGDSELIAANAVEMIARRVNFPPEAINQIKTALIEACINAEEHSFSPDRKIYQRFRLESDKLVVTVSSRGVRLPVNFSDAVPGNQTQGNKPAQNSSSGRRGWGLKLIRSLMDEVEFERVDDGTRLRMTKYLRPSE